MAVVQSSQALLKEHALAQNKIMELEASSQKLPRLKIELQQIQVKLHQLAEEEEALRQKRRQSQEIRTEVSHLESNKKQLETEIKEVVEKLDLLKTPSGAKCPLCETELGPEGLRLIETKYEVDKQQKVSSLELNQTGLANAKMETESLENQISRLEARLNKDRSSAEGEASILHQDIAEAEAAGGKLKVAR